ncbi:MAG: transporter [Chitinophagaceae bacterium]|nr:transporter [Chitinophagaceae bacterium]
MKKIKVFLISVLFCISSFAQEKIDTDRPDQTESVNVVPKKYFQAEFGFNKENYSDTSYSFFLPTALLKYGIWKRVELRLEMTFREDEVKTRTYKADVDGFEPVEIGTKINLLDEKGLIPKTSFIAHVGFPFLAGSNFKPSHALPSFRFTMQHTLNDFVALGYNVGAEWDGESSDPTFIYTLAPGFAIGEKWYAYIEVFGFLQKNEKEHNIDGGVAYYITNNTKIDLSGGIGITGPLKNYIAVGFSFRLK